MTGFGNWTAETAVAITQRAYHHVETAAGELEAVAGFLEDLHGRVAAYGVNAEELARMRATADALAKDTLELQERARSLRDEVATKLTDG